MFPELPTGPRRERERGERQPALSRTKEPLAASPEIKELRTNCFLIAATVETLLTVPTGKDSKGGRESGPIIEAKTIKGFQPAAPVKHIVNG